MRVLITGITGQDGSYLAEKLVADGHTVCGVLRHTSTPSTTRLPAQLLQNIELRRADLLDYTSILRVIDAFNPELIFNLGAMSFVPHSWEAPQATLLTDALGVYNILEAMRVLKSPAKFYQASSSEMFGRVVETPQKETTPFYPRSPYGIAKLAGHWLTVNYRESFGLKTYSGICFNHTSPRRGFEFVSRKITASVARIAAKKQQILYLGNCAAQRDWGHAKDYVDAMWRMLTMAEPGTYVVATGETHTIQEFVETAFGIAGLDWKAYVKIDPALYRPAEVDLLLGDAAKLCGATGWTPNYTFKDLVREMVDADITLAKNNLL